MIFWFYQCPNLNDKRIFLFYLLQDEKLDLSFLQHIREVTGYVLISHVDVTRIVLPSLQIIRGRTLFKLNVHDDEFALIVTLSKMHNLELPALRGKIFFYQYLLYMFRILYNSNANTFCSKFVVNFTTICWWWDQDLNWGTLGTYIAGHVVYYNL